MDNKILILLMSCNQALYKEEEQACMDTFLKDAEGAGIPFYFYKGVDSADKAFVDEEAHTMYINAPDILAGTSRKTIGAFIEALKIGGWDYVLKTNVSTWLDIEKIQKAVNTWEGRDDRNIYGARYLANDASKNTPFPRGHFLMLSRSMVEGVVSVAPKLFNATGFPKTDDTLIGLSLLYHIHKNCGEKYLDHLMEVPSVVSWSDNIQEAQDFSTALCIRCKCDSDQEKTPGNMLSAHKLKKNKKLKRSFRHPVEKVETRYGYITYGEFNQLISLLKQKKEVTTENPSISTSTGDIKRTGAKDAMLRIRERIDGLVPHDNQ